MDNAIEVRKVRKRLDNKTILNDISFVVERGTITGLVGRNGSGKSSILKCIVGLWKANSGEIYVLGAEIGATGNKCSEKAGALIEYPALFQNMTLRENIDYFSALYVHYNKVEIERLLTLLNLKEVADKKVKTYSSGMRQKAVLLIILMKEPEILVLDEPTSMLDPNSAAEIREFLKEINRLKGITILISSHNLFEIEKLCNNVIVIQDGHTSDYISLANKQERVYILTFAGEKEAMNAYRDIRDISSAEIVNNSLKITINAQQIGTIMQKITQNVIDLTVESTLEDKYLNLAEVIDD